jgi:hypothetical protein
MRLLPIIRRRDQLLTVNEAARLYQIEAGAADIDLIGGLAQTAPLGRIE